MEIIDAIGRPCPLPVIEAKRAIAKLAKGEQLAVLVNDPISVTNLEKFAKGKGHQVISETLENGVFQVIFTVAGESAPQECGGVVVAIGSNQMGVGAQALGETLMGSFLFSLTELDSPPEHLLFYNSGVNLTTTGSDSLGDLQVLAERGTLIESCGACLNFYQLADQLQIGGVTNMYSIASTMAAATKLINL